MISVIVCSREPGLLVELRRNIADTIGVDYEVIAVDNSENHYTIFEAYNEGISRSRFPYLVFAHEDICFRTPGWGNNLIEHFQDTSIGLIATMGGSAFPACPAPWWSNELLNVPYMNMVQHYHKNPAPVAWTQEVLDPQKNIVHLYHNPGGQKRAEVVAVDGFFFGSRREIFNTCSFDTNTFDGFHCYDTDICFQVRHAGYKLVVVFDILIEHFSLGSINRNWALSVEKLADKWSGAFPILTVADVSDRKYSLYSLKALLTYCYWVRSLSYEDREVRQKISKYIQFIPNPLAGREGLLLLLWKKLGYRFARGPYKILKAFYK